jgi:hypothetical protein
VIKLTTEPGDFVCDPFAWGGVTAYVAERLKRRWAVADICSAVKERLMSLEHGVHPEPETNRKRIAKRDETSRALPLLDTITN